MGNPFAVLRGIIGSDILAVRPDWKIIDNPFAADDPIVALPALRPDVALFHAPLADRAGQCLGRDGGAICFTLAHAAKTSVVTVERVIDDNLLLDETLAGATIPAFYIGAVAVAPRGAWPMRLDYPEDTAHLREYLALAATEEGFARYLDRYVHAAAPPERPEEVLIETVRRLLGRRAPCRGRRQFADSRGGRVP